MGPDDARAVVRDERLGVVGGDARVLPPRFEQVQESRRRLTEQYAGVGLGIPQHLRRRFVDEADAVVRVHHENAFPQVLHDVLRELRRVRKVDFLAAHPGFAFAQPVRHGQRRKSHGEQHDAEHTRARIVGR
jgi:hypothetical protein